MMPRTLLPCYCITVRALLLLLVILFPPIRLTPYGAVKNLLFFLQCRGRHMFS